MFTVFIAIGAFFAYLIAYHTYGKFIASKIFNLDHTKPTPACRLEDGTDYVPTRLEILFGHHYTSIAGVGPIVGPAIAVIWGWLPALLWVLFGAIFMGAVHDFAALVISIRHEGKSLGDVAGKLVNQRVRTLFLIIIFFTLLIVIAVFCLVIAVLFAMFPVAVFPVWFQLPVALILGQLIYRRRGNLTVTSLIAVAALYAAIIASAFFPFLQWEIPGFGEWFNPIIIWTIILLIYAYCASVLPVWRLLQPRDFINGHQLFIALGLLALGILVSRPEIVAPVVDFQPSGAPPLWPMLFITVACGAISGFHCLVSSGTTAKQLSNERHALPIGFGGMLLEGLLAVFVLIAVSAGIGLGHAYIFEHPGATLSGAEIWQEHYQNWDAAQGLGAKVSAFVGGSANMLAAFGIPLKVGLAIMGVFVASFAATTLDTATRLQRYVVTELATGLNLKALTGKHVATLIAVVTAALLAFQKGGQGGMILWPLFGATNQLLACLALLVATVYLKRRGKPLVFTALPMLAMLVVTGWAMLYNLKTFLDDKNGLLIIIGTVILVLEVWMVIETLIVIVSAPSKKETPA